MDPARQFLTERSQEPWSRQSHPPERCEDSLSIWGFAKRTFQALEHSRAYDILMKHHQILMFLLLFYTNWIPGDCGQNPAKSWSIDPPKKWHLFGGS